MTKFFQIQEKMGNKLIKNKFEMANNIKKYDLIEKFLLRRIGKTISSTHLK